jgi:hypothetical protein
VALLMGGSLLLIATSTGVLVVGWLNASLAMVLTSVFPDRDRYHRPDCRYAKGRGSEKVTKATARRWGYEPCGVCNP